MCHVSLGVAVGRKGELGPAALAGLCVHRVMFSSGNVTEKARVAAFNARGQIVVDMFAGIGYFTIPLLVRAPRQPCVAVSL